MFLHIFGELHFKWDDVAHAYMEHWELVCRILVADKSEVEVLASVCGKDLDGQVCKCLPNANPLSSIEGCPTVRMTLGSFRSEAYFILVVKSLGDEFIW